MMPTLLFALSVVTMSVISCSDGEQSCSDSPDGEQLCQTAYEYSVTLHRLKLEGGGHWDACCWLWTPLRPEKKPFKEYRCQRYEPNSEVNAAEEDNTREKFLEIRKASPEAKKGLWGSMWVAPRFRQRIMQEQNDAKLKKEASQKPVTTPESKKE